MYAVPSDGSELKVPVCKGFGHPSDVIPQSNLASLACHGPCSAGGLAPNPSPRLKILKFPFWESTYIFCPMYELNFKVTMLPKSLNKALRSNRWKSAKANKAWDAQIFWIVRDRTPEKPLEKARIKLVRRFYRTLDYDGLVGSMKPVVDALVSAGVLKDDSWKTLGVWDVSQEFRPKSAGPELEIWLNSDP